MKSRTNLDRSACAKKTAHHEGLEDTPYPFILSCNYFLDQCFSCNNYGHLASFRLLGLYT